MLLPAKENIIKKLFQNLIIDMIAMVCLFFFLTLNLRKYKCRILHYSELLFIPKFDHKSFFKK